MRGDLTCPVPFQDPWQSSPQSWPQKPLHLDLLETMPSKIQHISKPGVPPPHLQGHRGRTRAHFSPEPMQLPTTPNCGCHCFCHGVLCTYVQTYVDICADVQLRILMTRVPAPLLSHPLKPELPNELLHFPCLERVLSSPDGSIVF